MGPQKREDGHTEPVQPRSAAEAAQMLEQTLTHFESMLGALDQRAQRTGPLEETQEVNVEELVELKRALREVIRRLEDALDYLGVEAKRLSDEAAGLASVAGRLETKLNELSWSFTAEPAHAPAPGPVVPDELTYQPNGEAVRVVLAAVPGFQGLMDAQRALSTLPGAEGASVVAYRNGEASIELVLREPVSARQIVEGLRRSTGYQLLIEESRPEALRLRLRFIE